MWAQNEADQQIEPITRTQCWVQTPVLQKVNNNYLSIPIYTFHICIYFRACLLQQVSIWLCKRPLLLVVSPSFPFILLSYPVPFLILLFQFPFYMTITLYSISPFRDISFSQLFPYQPPNLCGYSDCSTNTESLKTNINV